jgi:hypothetical protein
MSVRSYVFWDITPFSPLKVNAVVAQLTVMRLQNMVVSPVGTGTENDSAREVQQ